jgi:hypothetical protein
MEVKLQWRKSIGMFVLIKRGKDGDLAASRDDLLLSQIALKAGWKQVQRWSS